jgi:hypothetical protein
MNAASSDTECFLTLSKAVVNTATTDGTQCTEEGGQVFTTVCTADQGLCSTNRFKLKSIPKSEAAVVPCGLPSVRTRIHNC